MLTLPKIVERGAQPYVAIRRTVKIPFGDVIDATMPKLFQWLAANGVEPAGPPFFKYNVIDMANDLEMEFGVPTSTLRDPDGVVVTGTLPAGRYATVVNHGHYDQLMDATMVLIGWAKERGLSWDVEQTPKGDKFAGRFEVYPNDPREVPNPDDWETEIWIKLRSA
ncbi:MAG: GyrI-like domain-containing protein [Devosia sp.]|nr:GyrI-like domain-containing protein [Devosia sp.]